MVDGLSGTNGFKGSSASWAWDGANLDAVQLSLMVRDCGGVVPRCTRAQSKVWEVGVVGGRTLPELL